MTSPNLLMVSYFYPPAATGVRRLLSLAKHLPDHGWHPVILSCREVAGSGFDSNPLLDPQIGAIPVVRTGSIDPYRLRAKFGRAGGGSGEGGGAAKSGTGSRWLMSLARDHLFVPDDRAGWIPFAFAEGCRLVERGGIRAIYSSSYPQSAHIVAMRISRKTGVRWLADFRDGWTQNPAFFNNPNPMVARKQHELERTVASSASHITTVSPPITRHLQSLRPANLAPAETIYNGFEPHDFANVPTDAEPLNPGRKTLLYTGTFFGRRRPDEFFAALRLALQQNPHLRERWRVRFRCALSAQEHALLRAMELEKMVEVLPPISHRDIVAEQQRADAFLLVLEEGPGSDIMVSQKVFEYLACGRPLLAIIPGGAASELLEETGGATICTNRSVAELAEDITRFLTAVDGGAHPTPSREIVSRFERPRQARRFAEILDEMCGSQ